MDGILGPSDETTGQERAAQFVSLQEEWQSSVDPMHQQLAQGMSRLQPEVFVGGEAAELPGDNVDLERWFKRPKGHERRIHGRRHAGGTARRARSDADVGA